MSKVMSIIIDNGSKSCKAGFCEDEVPKIILPTVIGNKSITNTNQKTNIDGTLYENKDLYIGSEAEIKRNILNLKYPIESGIIKDWDNMEKIWNYIFKNELKITPTEHLILHTEMPFNSKLNREKMTQIMFELFQVPGIFISTPAILSLYACGRTTGIVLDSGYGQTNAISIFEGYTINESLINYKIGGNDLTNYLENLLSERYNYSYTNNNYCINTILEKDIKEKLCYISIDFEKENLNLSNNEIETNYKLPDGTNITISKEKFYCPEILFNPSIINKNIIGIHEMIYKSILKTEIDVRKHLYGNIILSGGNTLFPGVNERLKKELLNLTSFLNADIKIITPENRQFSTWIGGSILASLSSFNDNWITRKEYDEFGPSIVNRKT